MISNIKHLFCKHKWVYLRWFEAYDKHRNTRYSVKEYICVKCGKKKAVDGRLRGGAGNGKTN